ncbi:MAG: 3-hydroxyacyl-CoA dehydrogenase NAD-binding domain-containing protein, partial [Alphaproteobacteria bacterium]|nr:3-hydroxyacyl-CoA dehydrogenase NAD-binding domain-containing protein [Alphaproteobacteria bacterium]
MIEKIAVIGAGQMGAGITHVCALAGIDITLIDIDQKQIDNAMATVERNLGRQVARDKISEADKAGAQARIATAVALDAAGDADLVVEAVTEDESVKKEIFKALIDILDPDTLIATNTSSISVTRLAAVTDRPG